MKGVEGRRLVPDSRYSVEQPGRFSLVLAQFVLDAAFAQSSLRLPNLVGMSRSAIRITKMQKSLSVVLFDRVTGASTAWSELFPETNVLSSYMGQVGPCA
jgi:hypothetical protein